MKKLKEVNIGDKFGSWTVISESDKTDSSHNKYYTCKCECGTIREIVRNKLTSGHTKSCGCKRKKDMTGKVVKDLLFIEPVRAETSGRMVWKRKCLKCGRYCERLISRARDVGTCGHHNQENGRTLKENTKKLIRVENTCVQSLAQRMSKNNTSGIKGVSWDKQRGMWKAQITFKGKNYYLGRYDKKEEAAAARKEAEKEVFWPIIKKYGKKQEEAR